MVAMDTGSYAVRPVHAAMPLHKELLDYIQYINNYVTVSMGRSVGRTNTGYKHSPPVADRTSRNRQRTSGDLNRRGEAGVARSFGC